MPIFQPDLETLPRAELERLQRDRLRERFGVELEALAEQPFATKTQLRDAYPFGLLRVPLRECVRIHASSGTRGKATIVAYTRNDLAVWADCCARAVAAAGGGPGTVVHVAYGYGLFTGGLGLTAVDIYGLSEIIGPGVSAECVEARDGAHVNEDHFLVEVVSPESGEPLPDGDVGELVFTTLTKEALPFLRYRTGDLASVTREPCLCGRTFARMSRIVGRTDDMLIIRGVNVFPSEIERTLLAIPELAPHYQLVVERPGHLDELTVLAEGAVEPALVRKQLHSVLGLTARVDIVQSGTIPRSEGKALRVLDRRGT